MRRAGALMTIGALALAIPDAFAAIYRPVDKTQEKQELVSKLGGDINKVDLAIEATKSLIKVSSDQPHLPELYFRLAELYVERSRYLYARALEQHPASKGVLEGDKALEVQFYKRLAIETYDKILTDFADYPANDAVRFFKAHEMRELGDWEAMIAEYKQLIADFPASRWSIEARLILGDHHFDTDRIDVAETYYREILALPESHLHDMARYKLGWIRINQGQFKAALSLFEAVVRSRKQDGRGAIGDAHGLDVRREALFASVWPFTEVKKPQQAASFYSALSDAKTTYVEVMKRLANRYFIKTDYASAALIYREIVRLSADVAENIEYVQRIYESVRNMSAASPKRYAHAAGDVAAITRTLAEYEDTLAAGDKEKASLANNFELLARDLATKLHLDAQQKRDVEAARSAAEAYALYLTTFPQAKERRAVQTNRAEALFQAGDFVEAGRQYEEAAKATPEGNERRDVLYSAIVAYYRALDTDGQYRKEHPSGAGLLDRLTLLRAREGLKQAGAHYVRNWPQSPKVPEVKFNIARMYYQQAELERAVELFTAFVAEHPDHKDAATAGELAFDSLNRLERYQDLGKLAAAFAANKRLPNSFRDRAARIGEAARRRNVEAVVFASEAGDFSERMLEEWEKHQGTAEGEDFLYTAFIKYKADNNLAGLYDFGGRLVGAYPRSARIPEVLSTMGSVALRVADYERAAALFELYHSRFPKQQNALELLATAASLRLYLGDFEHATKSLRLLATAGGARERLQSHQRLMELYRDTTDWKGLAATAAGALAENDKWAAAAFYQGLAAAQQGMHESAAKLFTRALKLAPRDDFDREALARAPFELGRVRQRQFESVALANDDEAEAMLAKKLALLDETEKSYVAAVKSGDPRWVVASLFESSRVYRHMAQFVTELPVPRQLAEADSRAYEQALKQQAMQYETNAQQALRICAEKAEQLKVVSSYASACLSGASEPPPLEVRRHRTTLSLGEAEQATLTRLREQLAREPESSVALAELGRFALQVADYHLAKLALSKAVEADARNAVAHNLLGIANWSLGEPGAAQVAFTEALELGSTVAAANLAALYQVHGQRRLGATALKRAGGAAKLDLSSPDLHPSVKKALQELSAS